MRKFGVQIPEEAEHGASDNGLEHQLLALEHGVPHWLQISAFRGLGCREGQSLKSYDLPQKLQNIGSPCVMR